MEDVNQMSFEAAMGELESVVKKLEGGDFTLDQALGAYERGMALKKRCEAALKEARLRVTQMNENGESQDVTEKFDAAVNN